MLPAKGIGEEGFQIYEFPTMGLRVSQHAGPAADAGEQGTFPDNPGPGSTHPEWLGALSQDEIQHIEYKPNQMLR